MGADLVLETVSQLTEGHLEALPQYSYYNHEKELKNAPKIFKEHCHISWDQSGKEVNNLIRGLSPYPTAFSYLEKSASKKILCKVFSASFEAANHAEAPGSIHTDGKKTLKVAVKDGFVQIHSIQQEGKRRMDVRDFLAGINLFSEPCQFF